jgi:hypothetical protein
MNCVADCLVDFLGLISGFAKASFTFAFSAGHQVCTLELQPAPCNNLYYCLQMDIFVVVPDHILYIIILHANHKV